MSLIEQPISQLPLVFLDTETTGLAVHKGDEIIEFGAVKVLGGQEIATLDTLIRPSRSIPPESTKIHGISDLFVMGAPVFSEFAKELLKFIDGSVVIAHNAPFDLGFLAVALENERRNLPDNPVLDTVAFFRSLLPHLMNHKLDTLKKHFDVKADRAHRALDDSRALAKVFNKVIEAHFPLLDGGPTLAALVAKGGPLFRFKDFESGLPITVPEHRALYRLGVREDRELTFTIQEPNRFMPEEVRLTPRRLEGKGSAAAIHGVESGGGDRRISVETIKGIRAY